MTEPHESSSSLSQNAFTLFALYGVMDSQNSDFDDDTIANEDGKLDTEKMLFSSK